MQRVILNFAGCNLVPKKVGLLLPLLMVFLTGLVHAQSSGIFESYAILSINGGANAYYDMQATTGNPDFQGSNLGSFAFGTNTLVVKGGQNKTYKNGGCDITGSTFYYRVYKTGNTPGSFVSIALPFDSNMANPGDQIWQGTSGATNLIASLAPGSYTLEVYSESTYTGCGSGTHFSSNGSANYKATFTVTGTNPVFVTSTGGTAIASYTTLKGAFDAVNAGTHTGSINIEISGNTTETAIASLNASGAGSASYTVMTITPTGARTVTGSMATEMILFNGADNVTINGLNTGGNSLTISNTSNSATSGTSTIKFIGGATSNTVTNCTILGSSSMAVGTNGGTIFFSTDGTTANGNDNNTISNCNIGPAGANLPSKAIYGNGSTTTKAIGNSGIIINNNNIYDFFGAAVSSAGIHTAGGCNGWSITNNKFYQTASRTWTTGSQHTPIWITPTTATQGAQGFTITGNTIGFASDTQTGTYTLTGAGSGARFIGIHFNGISSSSSDVTTISNNTIAGISVTGVTGSGTTSSTPFAALFFQEGVGVTNGNTIGSQSATGSLVYSTNTTSSTDVYGIYNFSSNIWTSNNNIIGGISATNTGSGTTILCPLRANTLSSVAWTANSNTIGGTVANSIQLSATSTSSQLVGLSTLNAPMSATSNTVRNLTTNIGTGTTSGASMIGIGVTNTQNSTISQSTVSNLSNTNASAASVVLGMYVVGLTNTVERNFIHSLSAASTSATAEVSGIRVAGGTTTYKNNMIALGTGVANAVQVNGIVETSGTDNFYHNSVYIGGSPTAGTGNSYAFQSTVTSSTRAFRNNIFVNNRSNSGATGKNYIVRVGGTTANPSGLTINNNVYFGTGTGSVFGFFNSLDVTSFANWKTNVGQDALSFNSDPQFVNPATPDLHINPSITTPAEGAGASIAAVTDDFDGQTRSGLTPVDIGADAGNFTSAPVMVYTSSTSAQLTGSVCTSATNVPVLRMEVVTTNAVSPLTLTSLTINGNGTSNLSDVATYRIYYTGTSATFSTATPIIAATTGLTTSNIVVTPSGTVTLSEGTNYFWLVYNLAGTVTGPALDAEFTAVALSAGGGTPTVTAPSGTVSAFPTPSATAGSNSPVCSGNTLNLTGGTNFGTGFSWTGPNSFASTDQNPSIANVTAANAGTYNLTVTSNGCTSVVSSVVVAVTATPVAPTTTGYSMCLGGTIPSGQGLTSTAVGAPTTTGSQVINFDVAGQPVETQSAPGNIVASATMNALPAGATVTGVTIAYNNLTANGGSWRSDIKLGLSGALVNAAASGTGSANSAGTFNYTRTATTGITATPAGGTVNLLYWDDTNDVTSGADATFPTGTAVASVTVNYTYPDPANVRWFTASTGGTQVGTGSPFNPIGVDPAVPDSNTPGSHTYYAEVINGACPSGRTAAVLQIGSALTISSSATPNTPVCEGTSVTLATTVLTGGSGYVYSWKVGATEVSTAASFAVTPATTTTYDLTVTDACLQTATASITVNVNPLPVITTQPAAPAAQCSGVGVATISVAATGAATYQWRRNGVNLSNTAPFSGADTATLTITNPVEANAGNYDVVVSTAAPCSVTSNAVALTVNPAPPATTGVTICQGGTGNLTASGSCNGFINSGTTISGTWAATPIALRPTTSISNTTTCSFDTTITRNYVATNFQVSATGNYTFTMNNSSSFDGMGYIVTGAFVPGNCSGGGTWIKGDDDGGSNEPIMTATLTQGVTYTLISTNYGSSSGTYIGSFGWTITPPAGAQIMLPGTGTIDWYTAASGGSPIGSGASFNPVGVANSGLADTNTAGTTTYYAACSLNPNCRTATTFTINTNVTYYADADGDTFGNPAVSQVVCTGIAPAGYVLNNTDCDDNNNTIHQTFPFYVDADHDTYGTGSLVQVCAVDANTPPVGYSLNNTDCNDNNVAIYQNGLFYVDADGDGYTVGAQQTVCYGATTPTGYSVTSNGEDCNDNNIAIYQSAMLYVDADGDGYTVGAQQSVCYGATIPVGYTATSNGEDCDDTNNALHQSFPFYVDADNDTYGAGSLVSVCAANATTPPTGYSLNNTDCNDSDNSVYQSATLYVDADSDGYTSGASQTVCYGATVPAGFVASLTAIDCNDSVAAIHPNAVEIPYNGVDDDCDNAIDETGTVTTTLLSSSCGVTLTSIGSLIGIQTVGGHPITGYRIRVTNGAQVQVIEKNVPHFTMPQFPSYAYATTYTVEIQLQRAGIWQASWGTPCFVSTPAILEEGGAASVSPSQCGLTLPKINTLIATTSIAGVTGYRFRITNLTDVSGPNQVQTIDRVQNWFSLQMLTRYNYGTTYRIEVAVKTTGTYGGYGAPCEIMSPAVPSLTNCGGVATSGTQTISVPSISGATQYRFQITRQSDNASATIDRSTNYFIFNAVPSTAFTAGALYTVRVAVMTTGTWSPFGDACEITAPGGTAKGIATGAAQTSSDLFKAQAYPNPFTADFGVDVTTSAKGNVQLQVYDMLGKLIESREVKLEDLSVEKIGANYPSGVYNVIVSQDNVVKTLRVIKR
ncbi:BNR-repeat neuraminidase N-terminal domain-containing protein [Flavobacterium sp.]|uniref:BNR-repeat neuraminidase N-terminal domain-containing protein n=1 Tax=Flavobacterium sp. TaxID=239 RepID=UPI0039E2CDDF